MISQENKKILFHYHAGCDTEIILDRIGLSFQDLHTKQREADWKSWLEKAEDIYIF